MIIEKLIRQEMFTEVEKNVANYLLKNGYDVKNMSISSLARATYSSSATITRFCHRLGLDGYKKFQILFNLEYEAYEKNGVVNVNYPFTKEDSYEQIAKQLERLNRETITKTISCFDYSQFNRIVRRMNNADMINIFSVGTSATLAMEFQQKMLRFGKIVNLTQAACFLPGYALASTYDTVNLVISQSGENRDVIESLNLLNKQGYYTVGITATPNSTVARLCKEVIIVGIEENNSYEAKIDTFAIYSAFHFILDCLFSFLYQYNFDINSKNTREKACMIEKSKRQGL